MLITMPEKKDIQADFCIQIDFDKESPQPSRVFRTMTELIETFETFDKNLIRSVDSRIETVLLLEDIESGSIRAWLVNRLKSIPDDVLESGDLNRVIGAFLKKGKYITIDFLEDKTEITSRQEIKGLQRKLLELAENTGVHALPAYAPISRENLLMCIEGMVNSLGHLSSEDKAAYITDDREVLFNREFNFVPENIEELLTKQTLTSAQDMILKVKKPDYLGESMWDFKHGGATFSAKIKDEGWLQKFQLREVDTRPGDSLHVRVEIVQKYDYDNNLVATHYTVLKVLEVLPAENAEQGRLNLNGDGGD